MEDIEWIFLVMDWRRLVEFVDEDDRGCRSAFQNSCCDLPCPRTSPGRVQPTQPEGVCHIHGYLVNTRPQRARHSFCDVRLADAGCAEEQDRRQAQR
jgi:hypothetical protein